jgi:uncharacterized membrane protein
MPKMSDLSPDLIQFIGRFHPLLVHLPIGFLVLLASLELLACWQRMHALTVVRGSVLMLTVPTTILSAVCGCLLARGGGYDTCLLEWHRWSGFGVAGACLLVLILHILNWRATYAVALALTLLSLVGVSHFGGSLTHGTNYLTRYLPSLGNHTEGGTPVMRTAVGTGSGDAASVFATLVQPLLVAKCVACHGPVKAKCGLRVDTMDEILHSPKYGPVLVPGNAAASELVTLLDYPLYQEGHMPPAGAPQMTADEIELLRWWVDAGAPDDKTAAESKLPANLQHLLNPHATPLPAPPDRNP